jgi:hypothetical protein
VIKTWWKAVGKKKDLFCPFNFCLILQVLEGDWTKFEVLKTLKIETVTAWAQMIFILILLY